MAPRALRMPVRPAEDDVVDDSEPERQMRRQEHSNRRRVKRPPVDDSVIVLSSDEDGCLPIPLHEHTLIEISDSSDAERIAGIPHSNKHHTHGADSSFEGTTGLPSTREILGLSRKPSYASYSGASAEPPPPTAPTQTTQAAPVTQPEGGKESPTLPRVRPLDLARFAYTSSSRSLSRGSTALSGRSTPAPASPLPPPLPPALHRTPSAAAHPPPADVAAAAAAKPRKAPRPAPLAGLSDAELGRLRKCVCCDLAWTARKTAPQKAKHMAGCARKRGLVPETVLHLVRAELQRTREAGEGDGRARGKGTGTGKGKGKGKEGEGEGGEGDKGAGTLLAEALAGAGARKRQRRPAVVESVRELAQTRAAILERARLLLESAPGPASAPRAPTAGPLAEAGPSRHVDGDGEDGAELPPATQPFGESALARMYRPAAALHATQGPAYVPSPPRARSPLPSFHRETSLLEIDEDTEDGPPQLQPSGASALARRFGRAPAHAWSADDEEDEAPASPSRTRPFGDSALARRFSARTRVVEVLSHEVWEPVSPERHVFYEVSNSSPGRASPRRSPERADDDASNTTAAHSASASAHGAGTGRRSGSRHESPPLCADDPRDDFDDPDDFRGRYRSDDDEYGYGDGWDDAVIHYDPANSPGHVSYSSSSPSASSSSGAPLHTRPFHASASASASPSRRKSTPTKAPTPPKTKGASKAKRKPGRHPPTDDSDAGSNAGSNAGSGAAASARAGEPSDAALHATLRTRIRADAALYARILRYEPVPFATFLALAAGLDAAPSRAAGVDKNKGKGKDKGKGREKGASGRFRVRVRDFLDAQAIHFYGDVVGRARTKRRRK